MNRIPVIFLAVSLFLSSLACTKKHSCSFGQPKGKIEQQGMTTYQYGSHILVNEKGETMYALKSKNVNLNDYLDQEVEIIGQPVNGYPIEGGPQFMDVLEVK